MGKEDTPSSNPEEEGKLAFVCNQYRDWLIPAVLFAGIAASVFLVIITFLELSVVLIISASLSVASLFAFLLALLWAVSRLESIEIGRKKPTPDGGLLFLTVIAGILLLCLSIVLVCFWKSTILGITVTVLLALTVFLFMRMVKVERAIE